MISAGSRSLSWSPVSGPDFLHRALLGRKVPVLSAMDQEIFSNIDKLRVYNEGDKFEDPLWVVAERISDRVDFVDFISLLLDAYDSGHVDDAVEVINAVLGQSNRRRTEYTRFLPLICMSGTLILTRKSSIRSSKRENQVKTSGPHLLNVKAL